MIATRVVNGSFYLWSYLPHLPPLVPGVFGATLSQHPLNFRINTSWSVRSTIFALSRLTGWSQYNESVFFRWYNLNLNLNHQKDIQKEIASWYLVVPGSAQVDWCWLEPPDHAHGLPPGPAPLDALQSVAAATEAVAAALSWAAGGKGSEESAGVTWPKRDRCVFIYILSYIYIYITLLRVIPTMAFQGILRHKFWHVVLHIFWHFT